MSTREDRLVGTTGCDKPAVTNTYDGLDRQVTTTAGTQRRIRYAGLEDTVLAEEDADTTKTAQYLLGPDGSALGLTGTAGRQMLATDPQGSTVYAQRTEPTRASPGSTRGATPRASAANANAQGEFSHRWNTKYWQCVIKSADVPG